MIWMDYTIEQFGEHFTIKGDWPGEVMGLTEEGTPKDSCLYRPGDIFVVDENGILRKTDQLKQFLNSKTT